jgi:hypothetical protein
MLGYPEAALKDVEQALSEAREVGQAAALMYALDPQGFGAAGLPATRTAAGGLPKLSA